jgi:uncharacterized repeat protein (TIGR04076 family)
MKRRDYLNRWRKLSPIVVRMIKKDGKCAHELGDTFYFENPYEKPRDLCNALLHVLDLYTWRVVLGFPSWEEDSEHIYRIHCPSKKGTVWEMKKARMSDYRDYLSSVNHNEET